MENCSKCAHLAADYQSAQRNAARKAKDFKRADAMRDELKSKGWIIEDTPKGARVKRI